MKFTFGYHPYIDIHNPRGLSGQFVCHTLKAISVEDGKEAGYIKISYIPSGIFENSIIPYLCLRGKIYGEWGEESEDELLYHSAWPLISDVTAWHEANDIHQEIRALGVKEGAQQIRERIMPKIVRKHKKAWEEEIAYHVDSPKVDFVSVHEPYRGQGLAERLYYGAAKWMHNSFGLRMRFSTLQSERAEQIMQRFIDHDMTTTEKITFYGQEWTLNWLNVDKSLWLDTAA